MSRNWNRWLWVLICCGLLTLSACQPKNRPAGGSNSSEAAVETDDKVTDAEAGSSSSGETGSTSGATGTETSGDVSEIDLPATEENTGEAGATTNEDTSEAAPTGNSAGEVIDDSTSTSDKPSSNEAIMSVIQSPFGKTPDGKEVDLLTCTNKNGAVLKLMTYGAAVQSLEVPDKNGKLANVQLGFADLDGYLKHGAHFGCTVGRFANRIAKGTFTLDGQTYDKLPINNGENHLHGGPEGFDRQVWSAVAVRDVDQGEVGAIFRYVSADGEAGYPGKLDCTVYYMLTNNNELRIEYVATTDKPTVLNLTNHCYWNLGGDKAGSILDHELTLNCDEYLEAGPGLIPTGKLLPVKGTVMDFTKAKELGAEIAELKKDKNGPKGYDHCYVVDGEPGKLRPAARVHDPKSGRVMEILTTQPGIQLYTGNFLDGSKDNGGHQQHGAFCLETQHYPDSPNQEHFPTTMLKPGEEYHEVTVHKFSVE